MKSIFNRAPLLPNTCTPLSPGAIRPEGWLGAQLRAFEAAVCADLPRLFQGEGGWERELYAFETIVALAWTLENDALKEEAARRAEAILSSQNEEGWFGPEGDRDYWPRILALRALRLYFEATADRNVLKFMDCLLYTSALVARCGYLQILCRCAGPERCVAGNPARRDSLPGRRKRLRKVHAD